MESINILQIVVNYLIPLILGGIIGRLSTSMKKIKKYNEDKEKRLQDEQKIFKESLKALLRNELVRRYREYETKGEMSIIDKENVEAMFEQYRNLGGNGTVKHLMDELLELPTKVIKS